MVAHAGNARSLLGNGAEDLKTNVDVSTQDFTATQVDVSGLGFNANQVDLSASAEDEQAETTSIHAADSAAINIATLLEEPMWDGVEGGPKCCVKCNGKVSFQSLNCALQYCIMWCWVSWMILPLWWGWALIRPPESCRMSQQQRTTERSLTAAGVSSQAGCLNMLNPLQFEGQDALAAVLAVVSYCCSSCHLAIVEDNPAQRMLSFTLMLIVAYAGHAKELAEHVML